MKKHTVFLFGEAEKGELCTPYLCNTLSQLADTFGNPPTESSGIALGVQALLNHHNLIYYRVKEEGFSSNDYYRGLSFLKNHHLIQDLGAICLPGVGDQKIIQAAEPICHLHGSILVIKETDLLDYMFYGALSKAQGY